MCSVVCLESKEKKADFYNIYKSLIQIFDTNPGYKSFGKKFLRKNFHEKANNLFGKHSVEKFPWKKKKKTFCLQTFCWKISE